MSQHKRLGGLSVDSADAAGAPDAHIGLDVLVYDPDLRAPACVLLQAAFGCGASPAALKHFDSKHWLTHPTPGMRKIAGTPDEWKKVAAITAAAHGDKRPT